MSLLWPHLQSWFLRLFFKPGLPLLWVSPCVFQIFWGLRRIQIVYRLPFFPLEFFLWMKNVFLWFYVLYTLGITSLIYFICIPVIMDTCHVSLGVCIQGLSQYCHSEYGKASVSIWWCSCWYPLLCSGHIVGVFWISWRLTMALPVGYCLIFWHGSPAYAVLFSGIYIAVNIYFFPEKSVACYSVLLVYDLHSLSIELIL